MTEHVQARARSRKIRQVLSMIASGILHCCLLAVLILSAWQLLLTYRDKEKEVARKQAEVTAMASTIDGLEARNHDLRRDVAFLKTDAGLEKVAREKLDMVKPREVTFQVVLPPEPAVRPTPKATPLPTPDGWFDRLLRRLPSN